MRSTLCRLATVTLLFSLFHAGAPNASAAADLASADSQGNRSFDLVIYGGTSAGVIAAVEAKKMGKSAVIICPETHLGGLTSGGLGWTDTGNKAVIGGLAREFYHRIWKQYEKPATWKWQKRESYGNRGQGVPAIDGDERTMWIFEPHVAEQVFEELVAQYDIPVHRDQWLDRRGGVKTSNGRIQSITMISGKMVRGRMFIDATYEGDLMAAAGVKYAVGREATDFYDEKWNGVQVGVLHHRHHFDVMETPIDPYSVPGNPSSGLLPRISADPPGIYGQGDRKIQAYCFRMCLTNAPENRLPFPKPKQYDPQQYELLLRIFNAGWRETFDKFDPLPNHKTDTNNHGPFSTDNIGRNYDYPEASYQRRREIIQEHKDYQQGLMFFIANDPRVPDDVQQKMQQWGLARDEFLDNGHWPHQLYVRESRRMLGRYVMTENELLKRRPTPEPIGMGSYTMDSHHVQRYITPDGYVQNEGDIGVSTNGPYQIAFGSILPKKAQCENLLVPVCVSSSHIAFGSIRMEPVFMILGQSAAATAAMAIDADQAVQDVDYQRLRDYLLDAGQVLAADPQETGATLQGAGDPIVLRNDHLSMVIDRQTGTLRHLVDRAIGQDLLEQGLVQGQALPGPPDVSAPEGSGGNGRQTHAGDLWHLHVTNGGQAKLVTPGQARSLKYRYLSHRKDEVRLTWSDFNLPDMSELVVDVTVRLDDKSATSQWHIAMTKSAQLAIDQIDFPRVLGLVRQEHERLAVPIWMGQEIAEPRKTLCPSDGPARRWAWSYPGLLSMQCLAFYQDDGPGFYTACNDTAALRKTFSFWGDADKNVNFETRSYPIQNARGATRFELPYEVIIGTFCGDWITAAERYRQWATKQPWATASRLQRGLVPEWVLKTSLWIWNRGRSPGVLPPAAAFRERLGLPVSVFWHWWHGCPYDIGFPEYIPPREGTEAFQQALVQAHQDGLNVIVYMNQRAWGLSTDSWKREGAERFAVKGKNGQIHKEIYNTFTKDALVPMCLATSFWRNKYAGLAEEAVRDLGVDGIYMDQACSQLPCYDPNHGHPPGGGDSWINGFRTLTDNIRERCATDRQVVLAGEGCGEAWLPYLDLMLALQVSKERYASLTDPWEVIPFFHAVYHPYGITYGNYSSLTMPPYDELWPAESAPQEPLALLDRKFSQQFYLEQARTFVWGQQPALANFRTQHFDQRADEVDYLARLAKLRDRCPEYLLYGEFLRPPKLDVQEATFDFSRLSIYAGQQNRLTSRRKQYPLALAGAWRASDGKVAIALASIANKAVPVTMTFDPQNYGLSQQVKLHGIDHTPNCPIELVKRTDTDSLTFQFNLPARALWILELHPN